jgi:hypothetical protein
VKNGDVIFISVPFDTKLQKVTVLEKLDYHHTKVFVKPSKAHPKGYEMIIHNSVIDKK